MRVLLLANNRVGLWVTQWLKTQPDKLVGLVLHPPQKRKYGEEILQGASLPDSLVFDGSRLGQPQQLERIRCLKADIAVSVLFSYILRAEFMSLFDSGVINLHPALLPFNRGANPDVWSIIDGTPSGATLHYIDEGVDTGDIIAQKPTQVLPTDTGFTLYQRLEHACFALFKETWPAIREGRAGRTPQEGKGTAHTVRDLERIDEIELDTKYTARELINLLRARTFPPYEGAFFEDNGRRVYLRLELTEKTDVCGNAS